MGTSSKERAADVPKPGSTKKRSGEGILDRRSKLAEKLNFTISGLVSLSQWLRKL